MVDDFGQRIIFAGYLNHKAPLIFTGGLDLHVAQKRADCVLLLSLRLDRGHPEVFCELSFFDVTTLITFGPGTAAPEQGPSAVTAKGGDHPHVGLIYGQVDYSIHEA